MSRFFKVIMVGIVGIACALVAYAVMFPSGSILPNYFVSDQKDVSVGAVENVVDGDTLHVLVNGRSETVRLVGVDTPESVHADASKNCEEGVIASDYTKSLLPAGTTVYLVRDVSNTDKYDRLLRYVWLSEPPEQPSEADAEASMLNAILVRDGYAQAKVYEPDVAWNNLFARLGNDAAAQGLGVTHKWAGDL